MQKVLYLRELKIIQTENMVAEFLHGVDIYLEEFRGAPNKNNNFMVSLKTSDIICVTLVPSIHDIRVEFNVT